MLGTMTDQQDVYSSHPAFSILASALLPPPREFLQHDTKSDQTSTWNLKVDIDEFGTLSSRCSDDKQKLFQCGTTIGLSYLREWGDANLQSRDLLGDVSRRLLTLFLAGLSPQYELCEEKQHHRRTTRVFIIHPIHSTTFAPEHLLGDLLACRKPDYEEKYMSETEALALLDRVELLPVHDFASVTQATSQVSEAISNIREQHRRRFREEEEEEEKDMDESEDIYQPPTTLLIIEGLDTMVENVIRNSSAMRGSAILTPVLSTLTHLSRTHASFLSILLVNTTALGSSAYSHHQSQSQQTSTTQSSSGGAGGLHSAFARDFTQGKLHHEGHPQPLFNTLLSRTLDQGIDTHLLLHVKRGQVLLEVIKDRTGNGLGKWCVWK